MIYESDAESRTVHYRSTPELERRDFKVESDPGYRIAMRSIEHRDRNGNAVPILLLHGARAPGVPSFDLDVPGGSLAAAFSDAGSPVYLMDVRNYGGSTRAEALINAPDAAEPQSRSDEVVRDVAAAVEHIRRVRGVDRVALMGWATGGQWLAHFAATHPERVALLVLYNSLWPVTGSWGIGDGLEDPDRPGKLKPGALPGYALATGSALVNRWESSIPIENLDHWRDPAVAEAYVTHAIASDPTANSRSPASLRTPLGAMADSFLLSRGHQLFDPAKITARVLVLRSELDFWSRPIDFETPMTDLLYAAAVNRIELPGATHFAHLDRPERGRTLLIESVINVLGDLGAP